MNAWTALAPGWLMCVIVLNGQALAPAMAEDLTELSLEELLDVEVTSTAVTYVSSC